MRSQVAHEHAEAARGREGGSRSRRLPGSPALSGTGRQLAEAPSVQRLDRLAARLSGAAGEPVAQRVLTRHGAPLAMPANASRVAKRLNGHATDYVLRDDMDATMSPLHVLDGGKRYLLGETHGDGSWAARTAHWSVPTLMERVRNVPEEASIGIAPSPGPGGAGALESVHPVTLQRLIDLYENFRDFARLARNADSEDAGLRTLTIAGLRSVYGLIDTDVGQVERASLYYIIFGGQCDAYLQTHAALPPQALPVYRFAQSLAGLYLDELRTLRTDAGKLIEAAVAYDAASGVLGRAAPLLKIKFYRSYVAGAPAKVQPMVAGSVAISGVAPEAAAILAFTGAHAATGRNAFMATPGRERVMAARVLASPTPVLVQMGNDHVASVATLVGGTAKQVDKRADFDAMTRRT